MFFGKPKMLRFILVVLCTCLLCLIASSTGKNIVNTDQYQLEKFSKLDVEEATETDADEDIADGFKSKHNEADSDEISHAYHLLHRERKKMERISLIKNQILQQLALTGVPSQNLTVPLIPEADKSKFSEVLENVQTHYNDQADPEEIARHPVQLFQSFYPSCSVPIHMDRTMWEEPSSMRIFYNLPQYRFSSVFTVLMAKLRLFKMNSQRQVRSFQGSTNAEEYMNGMLDKRVSPSQTVSVYVYRFLKPLRNNRRDKKRLVDSKILPINYNGWIEFNVIFPLHDWIRNSNRNFGFDVEVQDVFGNKLDPNIYFQRMNCSPEIHQLPPFPYIMDLYHETTMNDTPPIERTYPTLDLLTAEVSRDINHSHASLGEVTRAKRSAEDNETHEGCFEEHEYFNFSDVGLDKYIVQPSGLQWTFCDGKCEIELSVPQRADISPNIFLSNWIENTFKQRKKSKSKCAVTKRDPLTVVLRDGDRTYSSVLEDFVPSNCGCGAT